MSPERSAPPPRWLASAIARTWSVGARATPRAVRRRAMCWLRALETEADRVPVLHFRPDAVACSWVVFGGDFPVELVVLFADRRVTYRYSDRSCTDHGVIATVDELRRVVGWVAGEPKVGRHEMLALCERVPALDNKTGGGCEQ